jgi:hypothetical protein
MEILPERWSFSVKGEWRVESGDWKSCRGDGCLAKRCHYPITTSPHHPITPSPYSTETENMREVCIRKRVMMKLLVNGLILLAAVCCSGVSQAQVKIALSDTARVSYVPAFGWEQIDSIVFLHTLGTPPFCEDAEVYFDDELTRLAYVSRVEGDSCIAWDYWRNGQLKKKTIHLLDHDRIPIWWSDEIYCENGQLIFKGPSPNVPGTHHYITWYCSGKKKREFDHMDFGAHGVITTWFENGKIESEEYYDNGNPVGVWKYFDENGKLVREERH